MTSRINHVNLEDTGLSYRTFSVLNRAGFHTVGEVIKKTDQQLLEVRNLGVKCLEEIKREVFDEDRVLGLTKIELPPNSDCITDIKEFSTEIQNALRRAEITKISELRQATDYHLSNIRNLGKKSIELIDSIIPDRIKTYEGEADEINERCRKYRLDSEARRILRFMENKGMKLSELKPTKYLLRKSRKILTEYCDVFPERIPDVLSLFEAMGDTDERFYKLLKQKNNEKI